MKRIVSVLLVLLMLVSLASCGGQLASQPTTTEPSSTQATEPAHTEPEVPDPTDPTSPAVSEPDATEPEITDPDVTEPEITEPEVTEPEVTEPEVTEPEVTEPEVTEPEVTEPEVTEPEPLLDPDGSYTTKEDVALYIYLYGKLPSNFITKSQAKSLGWKSGSLERYAPGKCIGGDTFYNREGLLPQKAGRTYKECDIDTLGKSSRGAKRIVFSNDGLIYYTSDHYQSFTLLYGEP